MDIQTYIRTHIHTYKFNSEVPAILAAAGYRTPVYTYKPAMGLADQHIGSGIHFRTTYKIGIEISSASRSFLPILGPCVEQRNTTLYAMLDLDRLLMSEVNPANTKVPK